MDKFLIDGYNFLFRTGGKGASLEKKREHLLELLNEEIAPLRLNVAVVFDGSDPIRRYAQRGKFDCLEVIYTTDEQTADEYLVERLEQERHPATFIVVTADRQLAQNCKRLGARIQSIEEFLTFLEKKQKKACATEAKAPFTISRGELKRLLEIFEKRLGE